MARPKAKDLKSRCRGQNRAGAQCGMPTALGSPFCLFHIGRIGTEDRASMSQRLVALTTLALDTIEHSMMHAPRHEDRLRAAALVLQRTAPTSGPNVLVVNQNGRGDPGDVPVSEQIRTRLDELRERHELGRLQDGMGEADGQDGGYVQSEGVEPGGLNVGEGDEAQPSDDAPADQDDVIDAEIVPDPVEPHHLSMAEIADTATPVAKIIRAREAYVPRVIEEAVTWEDVGNRRRY